MRLRDLVVSRTKLIQPLRRGYGANGTAPYFWIAPCDEELEKLLEYTDRLDPANRWKRRVFHLIDEAAKRRGGPGWERLTVAGVESLAELDREITGEGTFDFNTESLEALSEICSAGFAEWVWRIAHDLAAHHQNQSAA